MYPHETRDSTIKQYGNPYTMRRWGKSRRGIATVVTSAILLTTVALMGSGVVAWANSNLFGHEQNLQSSYSSDINKINEYLAVENVWFGTDINNNKQFVNVTMNDPSTLGLNVTQIQLKTSSNNISQLFTNQQVFPKSSLSIQFDLQNKYPSKTPVNIYITTSRGSIFTTQALSP